ncbi:uncharacterized protein LOC114533219 [Dendronephthya gigantea]|uniref:uncharacterized protein LOC114533219 n=1 Tax=Dendronephthya gigantea TaxID=151771 RepID=UPI00106D86F9|nr:uncharacterized protein LOC114533219 [Dendronephthya gigantea]
MTGLCNTKTILLVLMITETVMSVPLPKSSRRRKPNSNGNRHLLQVHNFSKALNLKTPTNKRTYVLWSGNGLVFLQANKNLSPGTNQTRGPYAEFVHEMMATGIVRLYNAATKRYLAINRRGRLLLQVLVILLLSQTILTSSKQFGNTVRSKLKKVSSNINNGIAARRANRNWREEVKELKTLPYNGLLSDLPTNVIKCRLFSKTGYLLKMRANGAVHGTLNQSSKYTIFELQSYGPSIIRIKNLATNYYLVMKKNGLYTGDKRSGTLQSLFRETHKYNAFTSYSSVKFYHNIPYDMYLGIKSNGKIKRAMKTHRAQNSSQFLVIRI